MTKPKEGLKEFVLRWAEENGQLKSIAWLGIARAVDLRARKEQIEKLKEHIFWVFNSQNSVAVRDALNVLEHYLDQELAKLEKG